MKKSQANPDTIFVKALNQSYKFIDGHAVFYDGTIYEVSELLMLSKRKESDKDLQKIHLVKKMFQGEIL